MKTLILVLIRLYQRLISPLKPPTCRYQPTCSCYAAEALACHGLMRGLALTAHRLARCHPWGGCGFDPVPPPRTTFMGDAVTEAIPLGPPARPLDPDQP